MSNSKPTSLQYRIWEANHPDIVDEQPQSVEEANSTKGLNLPEIEFVRTTMNKYSGVNYSKEKFTKNILKLLESPMQRTIIVSAFNRLWKLDKAFEKEAGKFSDYLDNHF